MSLTMSEASAKAAIEKGLAEIEPKIDWNDHYIQSYPSLLKISQHLCKQAENYDIANVDKMMAITHMAYGWMPTILNKSKLKEKPAESHEQGQTILDAYGMSCEKKANDFIEGFKGEPINNSWVGLSKALHFINPEIFPIWDSKVAELFDIKIHYRTTDYALKTRKEEYSSYMNFCHSNLELPAVAEMQNSFRKKAGYQVSKIRAIEFILFTSTK